MSLTWTRKRDGQHNGKPCYEYHATSGTRVYHIVWAYDRGGTFGYTARDTTGVELTNRTCSNIVWARTLTRCKAQCEQIERQHANG